MSRNLRNVVHLPDLGWTPVVIAPRRAAELADPASMALISPAAEVIRAFRFEPRHLRPAFVLVRRVARVRSALRWPGVRRSTGEPGTGPAGAAPVASPATQPPARSRGLQELVFFPDGEIGWLPFAIRAALCAHRDSGFDVVYSTASPVTAHLVAGIIKRLTGVPWVAEFRDPWLGNPVAARLPWLHRRLQVKLERWIVGSADRLVFLSPSTMRLYRRRYPDAADMVTIPNGYEPSETIAPSALPDSSGRYRLVWTGTLYRPGELQVFLEALGALVARRPDVVDRLRIDFYGHVSSECEAVAGRLSGGPMGAMVRFAGFVPRHEALRAIADADAALVMLGDGPGMGQFIPGKLFEYLGQGKQVLAVLPPGDARDVLADLSWGVITDPAVEDIGRAIERLLAQPAPVLRPDPGGTYDGRRLARRLAETLLDATLVARSAG